MTLEEIRKNLKTFKECALKQIERSVENWVDKYCEEYDPNFKEAHPEIIGEALLDDEEFIEELAYDIAVLIQIKVVNDFRPTEVES